MAKGASTEGQQGKTERSMGKARLTIERLETAQARQLKYSKRKAGILKKAKELSVLCGTDLLLLMFSPTGKPTLFIGQNNDLTTVLDKMCRVSVEERELRRSFAMELLKKIYEQQNDSFVDPRYVPLDRTDKFKFQWDQLRELKRKLEEKSKILRAWKNPREVCDLTQIRLMEQHLVASLDRIINMEAELAQEQPNIGYPHQAFQGPHNSIDMDA